MKNTKIIIIFITLISISALFYSCSASVELTFWKDPNYKGGKFSKVVVMAIVKDLEYKKAYEYQVSKSLKEVGVNAIPGLEIFSPDVEYSEKDMTDMVKANSIDGVLTLKYTGTKIQNIVHHGRTYYQYYWDGVEVIKTPGYIEKHRIVNVECSLFPVSTGKAVWIASTKTRNYSSLNDLASSLGDDITDNLVNNNLIY